MMLRRKWRETEREEWIFLAAPLAEFFLPSFVLVGLRTAECIMMNRLEFYAGKRFVFVNLKALFFESLNVCSP